MRDGATLASFSVEMSVYDIPRDEWSAFCRRLTQWGRGAEVTIEIVPESGDAEHDRQIVAAARPLMGLDIENDQRLIVAVHEPAQDIEIAAPLRLQFAQHGEQVGSELRSDTSDGRAILIRFAQPLVPGILDGLP